jgi:hypothetical protein
MVAAGEFGRHQGASLSQRSFFGIIDIVSPDKAVVWRKVHWIAKKGDVV